MHSRAPATVARNCAWGILGSSRTPAAAASAASGPQSSPSSTGADGPVTAAARVRASAIWAAPPLTSSQREGKNRYSRPPVAERTGPGSSAAPCSGSGTGTGTRRASPRSGETCSRRSGVE